MDPSGRLTMGVRYPQPDNEDAFEQFCLRFYRKHWNNDNLALYAKRGEKQYGVDIHDPAQMGRIGAVQCKHHEATKSLKVAEIAAEVAKAETWVQPLELYVIATTAKKSGAAHDQVAKLNGRPDKKFTVILHFWEDICEFLSAYSRVVAESIVGGRDARAEFVASMLGDADLRSMVAGLVRGEVAPPDDDQYGDIEEQLNKRNLEAARYAIEKLPKDEAFSQLDALSRYKITRLRAKLALEEFDFDVASQLFLDAFALQPELVKAKENKVLAYSLANEKERAFALAKQYVAEGLNTPLMLSRLIECATTREALDEVMPLMADHLETDEDINVSLAHRLNCFGDASSARVAGERAVKIAPGSPHAQFAAGSGAHNEGAASGGSQRKEALSYAKERYTRAEQLATELKFTGLLPEILANRGAVNALLHDEAAAKADYTASVTRAANSPIYAGNAISYFVHERDWAGAAEILPYLDRTTEEGEFFAALTEFEMTDDVDRRRGLIQSLARLAQQQWERTAECPLHCVDLALRIGDFDLARSSISKVYAEAYPFQANTALAWIAAHSKEGDPAEYAQKAVAAGMVNTEAPDRRVLADILIALKDHSTALALLEANVTPGVLDDDTRKLVDCAQRVEKHDLLLRICRELRETGAQTFEFRKMEMQLLSRYAPEQGLALTDDFIKASKSPELFVAFKNWLAIRLNRHELLNFSKLPKPGDLSPSESILVSEPYVETKQFDEAIKFLYALLRLNFDDAEAHQKYIKCILDYGDNGTLHTQMAKVEGECGVQLELKDGSKRWLVIEDDSPVPSRGEFASDSPMGQCLAGSSVGDSVTLPGGFGLDEATIRDVQSKYVRAFQDSMEHFGARFPAENFVRKFSAGNPESLDLTEIIEAATKAKEGAEEAIRFYSHNPCTIHWLSERVGLNERDTMFALTHHESARIRCSDTRADVFGRLVDVGVQNEKVVLAISALVTLEVLEGWDLLDASKEYYVSRMTFELIEHWVAEAEGSVARESAHSSVTEEGKLGVFKTTQEERKRNRDLLVALKRRVESLCKISSAESVAAIEPSRRKAYERVAGFHNLEAIGLTRELAAAFWADDLILSFIGKAEFNLTCIWTQLALKVNAKAGIVTEDAYDGASAKLVGYQYESTVWDCSTIMQAGELAAWDVQRWPFNACIDLLGLPNMTLRRRYRQLIEALWALRGSSCSMFQQSAVVQAMLTKVRNPQLIAAMYERMEQLFGDDVVSAEFFAPEFEFWLRNHVT